MPRFSESVLAALRGVIGSPWCPVVPEYVSRLETTRVGIARRAMLVKNASLGVASPSIPATVVSAW